MQETETPPPNAETASSTEPAAAPAHIPSDPPAGAPSQTIAQLEGTKVADQPARKLAGKFGNVEDLEKSYLELQSQFGSRMIDSVETLSTRAGVNIPEITNAYMQDGKLPISAVEAFAKAGIGAAMAERMIQGEAAKVRLAQTEVSQTLNQVTQIAGGEAQRDNILNWAAGSLPASEITRLNNALANSQTAVPAMRELMFLHQQAVGSGRARPLVAGQTPAAAAPGYSSTADVVAAMARVRKQGYVDEETSRRLGNTPRNFIEGH